MLKCPKCHADNSEGTLVCTTCGTLINSGVHIFDTLLKERQEEAVADKETAELRERKIIRLPTDGKITLQVDNQLIYQTVRQDVIVLGRWHPEFKDGILIDTEALDGYRRGVSRRHAELGRNRDNYLVLIDLDSSNGTFLNGAKLAPRSRHIVTDGDEITLGEMKFKIHFSVFLQGHVVDKSLPDEYQYQPVANAVTNFGSETMALIIPEDLDKHLREKNTDEVDLEDSGQDFSTVPPGS